LYLGGSLGDMVGLQLLLHILFSHGLLLVTRAAAVVDDGQPVALIITESESYPQLPSLSVDSDASDGHFELQPSS
jgi:hypothetical protein